jgi:hypothetical protein
MCCAGERTSAKKDSIAASLKRVAMHQYRTLLEDTDRVATRGARSEVSTERAAR